MDYLLSLPMVQSISQLVISLQWLTKMRAYLEWKRKVEYLDSSLSQETFHSMFSWVCTVRSGPIPEKVRVPAPIAFSTDYSYCTLV